MRSATSGMAASVKLGRFPLRVSAISVNWLTTSASPEASRSERSKRPSSFSKIRSRATLPARRSDATDVSLDATPSRTSAPGPICETISAPTVTDACETRWTTARTRLVELVRGRTRPKRAAELDVRNRLLLPPLLHERATERVVRELVGGIQLHEDAKLGLRLLPAADPEVRDSERLADGARLGLCALRLLERDRRLRRTAAPEMGPTPLEQVVGLAHKPLAVRTERRDTRPRARAQTERSLRAARMRRRASRRARDASVAPMSAGPKRARAAAVANSRASSPSSSWTARCNVASVAFCGTSAPWSRRKSSSSRRLAVASCLGSRERERSRRTTAFPSPTSRIHA